MSGFKSSDHDPCLFVRRETDGSWTRQHREILDTAKKIFMDINDIHRHPRRRPTHRDKERNNKPGYIKDGVLTKYGGITFEEKATTFLGLALAVRPDGSLKVTQPTYTGIR